MNFYGEERWFLRVSEWGLGFGGDLGGVGGEVPLDVVVADEGETDDGFAVGFGFDGEDGCFASGEIACQEDNCVVLADFNGALFVYLYVGGELADDGLVSAHLGGGYDGVG